MHEAKIWMHNMWNEILYTQWVSDMVMHLGCCHWSGSMMHIRGREGVFGIVAGHRNCSICINLIPFETIWNISKHSKLISTSFHAPLPLPRHRDRVELGRETHSLIDFSGAYLVTGTQMRRATLRTMCDAIVVFLKLRGRPSVNTITFACLSNGWGIRPPLLTNIQHIWFWISGNMM